MSRYIDADRIDWRLILPQNVTPAEEHMWYCARKLIDKQPTADVVKVVNGKWIPHNVQIAWGDGTTSVALVSCSNCGYEQDGIDKYCSCCGAKMDMEEQNEQIY